MLDLIFILLLFIVGVGLLVWGADFAIDNAQKLGYRSGVSAITLGVLVVAFGTSLPELLVTIVAGIRGYPEIALGNVVGSNIANVGLIVGITGLIAPFATKKRLLRVELPMVLGSTLLLYFCVRDLYLERWNALFFLTGFGLYILYVLTSEKQALIKQAQTIEKSAQKTSSNQIDESTAILLLKSLAGLAALLLGSWLIVENGATLARRMGVSETLIGLSLVAIGTSLPELAAALAAARRRDADIIMGNILGSNIFNILLILGVVVMIHPFEVSYFVAHGDVVIAGLFSLALLPLMVTGKIRRPSGAILLLAYSLYMGWRFMA